MPEVTPVKIFVSYKKHDMEDDRNGRAFIDKLAPIIEDSSRRSGVPVTLWYDKSLETGTTWSKRIEAELNAADVIILVLSPGVFDPDGYIAPHELPVVLQHHERRSETGGTVVPLVRTGMRLPRDIPEPFAPLRSIQAAYEGRPLADLPTDEQDTAFLAVADDVIKIAGRIIAARATTKLREPVTAFLDNLSATATALSRGQNANPEDQLKAPTIALLSAIAPNLGDRAKVSVYTEAPMGQEDVVNHVRLDLAVVDDESGSAIGHIELKAPDKGADPTTTAGKAGWSKHDRDQWKKLQEHPNLIYCNGREWTLLRDGERLAHVEYDELEAPTDMRLNEFARLAGLFLSWSPIAPTTARGLAARLAPLSRLLREAVAAEITAAESSPLPESRPLWKMRANWQELLMPDASADQFADSFAQTFTYALLLARLSERITLPLQPAQVGQSLRTHGHTLLGSVIEVLGQDKARAAVSGPIRLLETTIAQVDPHRLSHRRETWLYFYEDFLAEYDPARRKDAGVYYTPTEIVKAQVRLVDHALKTRFGKVDGLGDRDVTVLDPATGTGTYLLTTITHTLDQAADGGRSVPQAATELARRIYGFELMVGAYAVAHLRLTQALSQAGAALHSDGVNIFLTDTLTAPHKDVGTVDAPTLPMWEVGQNLVEEQRRSDAVKGPDTPITVVIGNPPYDRGSIEKGRGGASESRNRVLAMVDGNAPLIEDYVKPAQAVGAGIHVKNLYNSYVYFWRWATWKACEQAAPTARGTASQHHGIVSFITSSSFLRGPGFVGMRKHLREQFDELWVIDLGGEGRGARPEENLFAIRTPVAIVTGIQRPRSVKGRVAKSAQRTKTPALVKYRRISGTRAEKKALLDGLNTFGLADTAWTDVVSGPGQEWTDRFVPRGESKFWDWPELEQLFPWTHSGVQFKRTWPISPSAAALDERWERLFPNGEVSPEAFKESRDRKVTSHVWNILPPPEKEKIDVQDGDEAADGELDTAKPDEQQAEEERLPALIEADARATQFEPVQYAYRSFDTMWCLPDNRVGDYLRKPLWSSYSSEQVYLTTLSTTTLGAGPAVTASAYVPDLHHFRGSFGARDVYPLWRDGAASDPNVNKAALDRLRVLLDRPTLAAPDLFTYVFGLLGTSAYIEQFDADLVESPARVPITTNAELFDEVAAFGRTLLIQATFAQRFAPVNEFGHPTAAITRGTARPAHNTSPTPYPATFSYDQATKTLSVGDGTFTGVREDVWGFEVSGLKVVQSWLGYRMANRKGRKSSPLDDVHPPVWEFDQELLDLLWVVEAMVDAAPTAANLLARVTEGPTIDSADLPAPIEAELAAPGEAGTTDAEREQTIPLDGLDVHD